MTPNELYARPPEKVDHDPRTLFGTYYSHVPEIDPWDSRIDEATAIEFRYYRYHWFDHRRFWRLASVWMDGKPIMVIQNAGREGDDHSVRFITDEPAYQKLVAYLRTFSNVVAVGDVVDEHKNIPELTEFYGNSLFGEDSDARSEHGGL